MTVALNSYLGFRDNARQAMEYYHQVFGGELTLTTFADFHASDDPAEAEKIMHGHLVAGPLVLMGSDTPNSMPYTAGSSISVLLSGDDEAALPGHWEKLAEEGTVDMPLEKAPWGDTFGMLTDKFGISWMVDISETRD